MVVRDARSTRLRRTRSVWNSLWLQLFLIALVATYAPLLVTYLQSGSGSTRETSTFNTQFASLIAATAAVVVFRRVTAYPGTRGFSYILPAFLGTYGVVSAIMLLGRFAYSGTVLAIAATLATGLMFVLRGLASRTAPMQFYIIPGSEGAIVRDTPNVEWFLLTEPILPEDRQAAIVADLTADHPPEWERLLATAAIGGRTVFHTKQLRESLTGRVQIDHLSENTFGSLLPNLAYFEVKRLGDILVALLALPVLVLPLLAVALAVRLDSSGPAIFRQTRMGYRGQPFRVIKFRTMRHGDAADPITRDGDDRVTRIGRFLRRTRIDELPQIINVLRGEMSVIGPRPEAVALSEWYDRELPFYGYRHIVRPGITGWAQIKQGHVAELDDVLLKLHYDFFYIKNFSAWLDIVIALRTVVIILTGYGSK